MQYYYNLLKDVHSLLSIEHLFDASFDHWSLFRPLYNEYKVIKSQHGNIKFVDDLFRTVYNMSWAVECHSEHATRWYTRELNTKYQKLNTLLECLK